MEHHQVGPAAVTHIPALLIQEDLAVRIAPLIRTLNMEGGPDILSDTQLSEQPEDLTVETGGAGKSVELRISLQNDNTVAGPAQKSG